MHCGKGNGINCLNRGLGGFWIMDKKAVKMEKYDVVLSFAGQDRKQAKDLADLLESGGYSFFYDENEQADLWGKDLYEHLSSVYKDQARYCVMFLSKHYARELWPNHERRSAQARAFQENREYILPVRLDDTEISGIPPTVGYLDLRSMTIKEVYEALVKKLSGTASRKTPSDDNNVPNSESSKEKSFNHERDQNVNTEDSKTSIGQEGLSEKVPHGNASNKPLKGFITYSHEDTTQKDELRKRLAVMEQNNELITWDDGQLTPGDGALQEDILEKVADSDLLLYLVSAASLASKNCNTELTEALKKELWIIPIILEDCDWLRHRISNSEVLPYKGKSINEWQPESKGWQNVVDGVRKVVHEMQSQAKPSPNVTPEEIETLAFLAFHRGNFMMILGQIDEALKDYSRAIELSPNNAAAYTNRGVAYGEKGEFDLAIEDYFSALKINPDFANAYNNRGYTYVEKDEIERAIKDLDKAVQLQQNFPHAYNNRGCAYSKKDKIDSAIQDFTKAIELDQDFAEAYSNRGTAYNKKGEIDLAIDDLNIAIHLKDDYVQAYINRAGVYLNTGAYNLAIKDCDNAIRLDQECAEAYNQRGNVYVGRKEFNRAIDDCDIAIQLKKNYPTAYYNRGVAYTNIGDFDSAIKDFNKATEFKPDYSEAYYNLGRAYGERGAVDLAIQGYTKAIELDNDLAKAYKNRGIAFLFIGEADLAVADFSKVIRLWPNDAITYYIRATQIWLHRDEWEKAKADLTVSKSLGLDISTLFYRDFCGVNNFEEMMNIRLRADIAALLTPLQA